MSDNQSLDTFDRWSRARRSGPLVSRISFDVSNAAATE